MNNVYIYPGKYGVPIETRTDEELILSYFGCLFGNKLTLEKVLLFDNLDEYCIYNKYSKQLVINTITNYKTTTNEL